MYVLSVATQNLLAEIGVKTTTTRLMNPEAYYVTDATLDWGTSEITLSTFSQPLNT